MSEKRKAKLCVVVDAEVHETEDGMVIVFELLGGDRWGCRPNTPVYCAPGVLMPACELYRGSRIWLDVEALTANGTFASTN